MTVLNNFNDLKKVSLDDISLVMWDMDGTIVSTEDLHAQAIYELLITKNISIEQIKAQFCGESDDIVFNKLATNFNILNINDFINKKNIIFKEIIKKNSKNIISPEIKSFLKYLKERGIKMALVTSSQREIMELILSSLQLNTFFNAKRCFEDNEFNKPNPYPYLTTLKNLNIEPSKAIIFEDSDVGYKAAVDSKVSHVYKACWY